MDLLVADTSALVSLGTIADRDLSPFALLLDRYRLAAPSEVTAELEETASYDDAHGRAAEAILDRSEAFEAAEVALDADFPLDDGENAAVALANDRSAAVLLCDEFNQLGLIHASLRDTRLVTTPTLLNVFATQGLLTAEDARNLIDAIGETRSWEENAYVRRARESLS